MNSSHLCPLGADDRFGPQIVGCRQDFDFTLLFEQSILSLAPSVIFLLVSVLRIVQLYGRDVKTFSTPLYSFKLAAVISAACLRLALLVLWITNGTRRTRISVASTTLSFTGSLTLAILSSIEHSRSIRPSFITGVYLFFSTLLDLAQARTLWLISGDGSLAAVFSSCVAVNVVMLVLESVEKRSFLKEPYRHYPPEAIGSIFNRSVFWWLNRLFLAGYRRVLNLGDLFETDKELSSLALQHRMRLTWRQSHKDGNYSLMMATLSCFKWSFSKTVFPRLCVSALKFCQPLLINRAVSLISQPRTQNNRNIGYGLIGATALIYFGLAIGNAKYTHKAYRAITMVRGGLISLISDVTLLLDADSVKESAAVTLMSADVDRIVAGLEYSDHIWAAPIEIAVALYLLDRELGLPCLVPLGISLGSAAAAFFVGNAATEAQKNWVDAVQKRVSVTASMLGAMKGVKMMGLSARFSKQIQALKRHELKQSNKFRRITTMRNAVSNFSFIMAPALTFAVYSAVYLSSTKSPFNPASAFTSLSIIALLSQSVQWWVIALFMFQASLGCYERIQKYLLSGTRKDKRLPRASSDDSSESDHEKQLNDPSLEKPPTNDHRGIKASHEFMIAVDNGSFAFSADKEPTLKHIDIHVKPGTLTMIIGPVGSGKSTLLKALLGEMASMEGAVYTSTREIGYCSQEPWLPNVTIRQAILGVCDFEGGWYNTVIRASTLDEDISRLVDHDKTVIGSKGVSLSGGQKQRLALARAVYSRKRLLLLDDVLSGLDGDTEQAVVQRTLGKEGLCREQGITVVMATHAVKYLRHADHIIALGKDGIIAEQGTFEELRSKNDSFMDTLVQDDEKSEETTGIEEAKSIPKKAATKSEKEIKARLAGDFRIYGYYAKAVGWILVFYLCTQATTTFLIKFPDVWLRWWSSAESTHPGQRTRFYLGIYCMFAGLALCSMVIGILTLFTGVMPRASARLHKRLLDTVMNAPYSFLAATDSGIILNRFSQDMSLIDMQLPTALLQTADGFMICVAQTILITTSSKFVAAFIPAAIFVLYLLQRFYLRTSRQIRLLDLETKSPMYSHFLETLSGLPTIRAFNWQSAWDERSRELLDRSQRPVYLLYCIQRWLSLALDCMVATFAIAIITLATQLHQSATSSGGALGVALVNLLTLSSMLSYLIRAWTDLETSIGAVLRVRDFESYTPSENLDTESQDPPQAAWPQEGTIEFRNVDVSYGNPSSASSSSPTSSTPVLKNISLSISPGSRIGICGRTGSGKSSLLLTLFHLTSITSGSLVIDGIDISTLHRSALRERLVAIPQAPELFPGTLRSNLDPLECSTDAEIEEALRKVELWGIVEARGGLDAEADKTPLSHGERQLFALACALLRRRHGIRSTSRSMKTMEEERTGGIVVLDEPTASVDVDTEMRISQIVHEEFRGWTVLSVAHRLSTIRGCDMIVVLDGGRIVECGKPDELENVEGSVWRSLVGRVGGGRKEDPDKIEVVRA